MADRVYYSKEAEQMARRRRAVGALTFMALGLGVGAVLALLFAPKSGDETRQLVGEALEKGYRQGREAAQDALHQLETEYPGVSSKVEDIFGQVAGR